MSDIQNDDEFMAGDATFESKGSMKSTIGTCMKKFLLAIIAGGLVGLLVFQICLIAGVVSIESMPVYEVKLQNPEDSAFDRATKIAEEKAKIDTAADAK